MRSCNSIVAKMLIVAVIMLTGCSIIKEKNVNREQLFSNLTKYEAVATVVFLKDNQPNQIIMKQKAHINGDYELEYISPKHLKGTKLSYDGDKIIENYPQNEAVIEKPGKAENEILITSVAKRIMSNKNFKKQEENLKNSKMITYEIPIEGGYKYLAKEKLWISKDSLMPVQLTIYDIDGNISIMVIYDDFKYN